MPERRPFLQFFSIYKFLTESLLQNRIKWNAFSNDGLKLAHIMLIGMAR